MTPPPVCSDSKDRFAYANQTGGGVIEVKLDSGIRGIRISWVQKIVNAALALEKKKNLRVGVLLTDNRRIRRINKHHLGHDYATDVISFGLDEAGYLGDLAVSVQTAKEFARELGIPVKEELARYLVHGTLHLLGYDDKKPKDKKKMHTRQEKILTRIL